MNKLLAIYLRKRGWVVFYLDEPARHCGNNGEGCWLKMYQASEEHAQQSVQWTLRPLAWLKNIIRLGVRH